MCRGKQTMEYYLSVGNLYHTLCSQRSDVILEEWEVVGACSVMFVRPDSVSAHMTTQQLRLHAQEKASPNPNRDQRWAHETPPLAESYWQSMAAGGEESQGLFRDLALKAKSMWHSEGEVEGEGRNYRWENEGRFDWNTLFAHISKLQILNNKKIS